MVARTAAFSMALQKRTLAKLAEGIVGTGNEGFGFTLPVNVSDQVSMNGTTVQDEAEVSCQVSDINAKQHNTLANQ